jgi:hypothetical protein
VKYFEEFNLLNCSAYFIHNLWFIYLLTPHSTVLLEKLTGLKLVKKFPAYYVTRKFITAFTSARHLFLSLASSIQTISPTSYFLKIHLNIILLSTSGSSQWSLSLRFPHHIPVHASPFPLRATCPAHHILPDYITRTILGEQYRSLSSSPWSFFHSTVTSPSSAQIFSSTPYSQKPSPYVFPSNISDQVSHP